MAHRRLPRRDPRRARCHRRVPPQISPGGLSPCFPHASPSRFHARFPPRGKQYERAMIIARTCFAGIFRRPVPPVRRWVGVTGPATHIPRASVGSGVARRPSARRRSGVGASARPGRSGATDRHCRGSAGCLASAADHSVSDNCGKLSLPMQFMQLRRDARDGRRSPIAARGLRSAMR